MQTVWPWPTTRVVAEDDARSTVSGSEARLIIQSLIARYWDRAQLRPAGRNDRCEVGWMAEFRRKWEAEYAYVMYITQSFSGNALGRSWDWGLISDR